MAAAAAAAAANCREGRKGRSTSSHRLSSLHKTTTRHPQEEGENSPFKILERDITRVLTTILVATTACTIYSAALFTNLAMELLGARGVAYSTVRLPSFPPALALSLPPAFPSGSSLFLCLRQHTHPPTRIYTCTQVALTVVTLVFGELIPKSLGVSNAEMVARIMVPPINILAVVLSPVGKVLSMFAKLVLRLLGAF